LNQFSDLTNSEFAALYTSPISFDSEKIQENVVELDEENVPEAWDWRDHNAVNPIKN